MARRSTFVPVLLALAAVAPTPAAAEYTVQQNVDSSAVPDGVTARDTELAYARSLQGHEGGEGEGEGEGEGTGEGTGEGEGEGTGEGTGEGEGGEIGLKCGDVKALYKENGCCGIPGKEFKFGTRRLSAVPGSTISESNELSPFLRSLDLALQDARAKGGAAKANRLAKLIRDALAQY